MGAQQAAPAAADVCGSIGSLGRRAADAALQRSGLHRRLRPNLGLQLPSDATPQGAAQPQQPPRIPAAAGIGNNLGASLTLSREEVQQWVAAAPGVLGVPASDVEAAVRAFPRLVLLDLLTLRSHVSVLGRVLSVPAATVAALVLRHPSLLGHDSMAVFDTLSFVSTTARVPYDIVAQWIQACPELLQASGKGITRAFMDVVACCGGSADAAVGALSARPGLLVMESMDIRRELDGMARHPHDAR